MWDTRLLYPSAWTPHTAATDSVETTNVSAHSRKQTMIPQLQSTWPTHHTQ